MNILFRRFTVFALGVAFLCAAGCAGSAPSKFYLLNSLKTESAVAQGASREQSIVVAVGPLRIPDYLDRPQIVTRSHKNELKFAEFDRWAGSLEQDISRVIMENISTLLPRDRFYVTSWYSHAQIDAPASFRVEVSVIRFDGILGESVLMKAQWAVFDKEGRMVLQKESNASEQVSGSSYESLVRALSNALGILSLDIANAITSLKEI